MFRIQERSLPDGQWENTLGVTATGDIGPLEFEKFEDAYLAATQAMCDPHSVGTEYGIINQMGQLVSHLRINVRMVDLIIQPPHIAGLKMALQIMRHAKSIRERTAAEQQIAQLVWEYRNDLFDPWGWP